MALAEGVQEESSGYGLTTNPKIIVWIRYEHGLKVIIQTPLQKEPPVQIAIPDEIVSYLQEHWGDEFDRRVLESVALEAYRERVIGEGQLQRWLGFATRMQAHAFLKEHGIPLNYTLEDLERDRQTLQRLGL